MGAACFTAPIARKPLAPGRASTTTGCFHWLPRRSPTMRAITSGPLPAGNGEMKRTDWLGKDWAQPWPPDRPNAAPAARRIANRSFMVSPRDLF